MHSSPLKIIWFKTGPGWLWQEQGIFIIHHTHTHSYTWMLYALRPGIYQSSLKATLDCHHGGLLPLNYTIKTIKLYH